MATRSDVLPGSAGRPGICRLGLPGLLGLLGLGLGAAACDDFRSPAELRFPQVLAVRLSAPELRPGEQSQIEALVSDESGALQRLAPKEAGLAPDALGRPIVLPEGVSAPLVRIGEGMPGAGEWRVLAPDRGQMESLATMFGVPAEAPVVVPLRFTFHLGTLERRADKQVLLLRAPDAPALPNPVVQQLLIDGRVVDEGGPGDPLDLAGRAPAVIQVGRDHALTAVTEAGGRPITHAWYAAGAEVDRYREAQAEIRAEKAGPGVLLVVVRNDRGGVGWRALALDVQPAPAR